MLELLIFLLCFSSIKGLRVYSKDLLHPFFWSNAMFFLYSLAIIYIYFNGVSVANFLQLAGIDELSYNEYVLTVCLILIGKFFLELSGPWMRVRSIHPLVLRNSSPIPILLSKFLAMMMSFIGIIYWLYIMILISDGSWNIFKNMGVWEYVIAEVGLTILPYHLVFAGSHLWFLSSMIAARNNVPIISFAFYPVAFLMSLTTGRLTSSILIIIVPVLAYYFIRLGYVPLRKMRNKLFLGFVFILIFYFYRSYTSYVYVGKIDDFFVSERSLISDFFFQIIGSGNIPDPQQIILLNKAISDGKINLHFGATYFDWLYNLLDLGPVRSVGYLIHSVYFPNKSGGPTPGMIGESIVNFGYFFFIPLPLFGYLAVKFYFFARKSQSYFIRLVYCIFLMNFWALFIKVDSSLIQGLLWSTLPIMVIWLALSRLTINYRV